MFGGSGEIRTHGPLSEPAVFKTAAINRTRPHFRISKLGVGDRTRTCIIRICNPAPSHSAHTYIKFLYFKENSSIEGLVVLKIIEKKNLSVSISLTL